MFIEAIVSDVLRRVVQDVLGRIEFWPVERELKYLDKGRRCPGNP